MSAECGLMVRALSNSALAADPDPTFGIFLDGSDPVAEQTVGRSVGLPGSPLKNVDPIPPGTRPDRALAIFKECSNARQWHSIWTVHTPKHPAGIRRPCHPGESERDRNEKEPESEFGQRTYPE